jgi:predicted nucleotidyltransferase
LCSTATSALPHESAVEDFVERIEASDFSTVQRLVLFGSVARETHSPRSDIDVLAVLDSGVDASAVEERLRDEAYEVMLDHGIPFSIHAVIESDLERRSDHPFFRNVLTEGRTISA